MRTIKYIFVGIMVAFLFAGCAGNQVKTPGLNKPDNFYISKQDNVYKFYWGTSATKRNDIKKVYGKMFNVIADYGLKNGYTYMALVNKQFNNLSGYPINSWSAMSKFIDIRGRGHFRPSFYKNLNAGNQPSFKAVFFKKRPKGLFLWNLRELKAETNKYK